MILENLVNTNMGIESLLEHRYCCFPKTLKMFQDEEKDSQDQEKISWCVLMHASKDLEELQIVPLDR